MFYTIITFLSLSICLGVLKVVKNNKNKKNELKDSFVNTTDFSNQNLEKEIFDLKNKRFEQIQKITCIREDMQNHRNINNQDLIF